jgi:hypothetical protein
MKKQIVFTAFALVFTGFMASAQKQGPKFKTQQEKQEWMKKQDPSAPSTKRTTPDTPTKEYGPAPTVKPTQVKNTITEQKRTETPKTIQLVNEPGFPPYIMTGNKEKDDANYSAAKDKWIKENPERYKKMNEKK